MKKEKNEKKLLKETPEQKETKKTLIYRIFRNKKAIFFQKNREKFFGFFKIILLSRTSATNFVIYLT